MSLVQWCDPKYCVNEVFFPTYKNVLQVFLLITSFIVVISFFFPPFSLNLSVLEYVFVPPNCSGIKNFEG